MWLALAAARAIHRRCVADPTGWQQSLCRFPCSYLQPLPKGLAMRPFAKAACFAAAVKAAASANQQPRAAALKVLLSGSCHRRSSQYTRRHLQTCRCPRRASCHQYSFRRTCRRSHTCRCPCRAACSPQRRRRTCRRSPPSWYPCRVSCRSESCTHMCSHCHISERLSPPVCPPHSAFRCRCNCRSLCSRPRADRPRQ